MAADVTIPLLIIHFCQFYVHYYDMLLIFMYCHKIGETENNILIYF